MFSLVSTLDPTKQHPFITITYDDETGIVKTELSPPEISALYRRLPLRMDFHHYELTPTTYLLNVLAECMQYAQLEKQAASKETRRVSSADIETGVDDTEGSTRDDIRSPFHPNNHEEKRNLSEMPNLVRASDEVDESSYPRDSYVRDDSDSSINAWDIAIVFYNTLFPMLDALADLEELINRFEDKTIESLVCVIGRYQEKVNTIFEALKSLSENEQYQKNIAAFTSLVLADIQRFQGNIHDNNKPENTRALLCNYIETNGVFPLGHFVIEQVERVAVALAQFRRLYEEYPGQEDYIKKSPDCQKVDVLLDNVLAFAKSFAGIRFSTSKPIPQETITVLRVAGGNFSALKQPVYDVILNDFVKPSEQADPHVWTNLFCQISGYSSPKIDAKSIGFSVLVNCGLTLITPLEVGIFFPARIFLVLVVGIATSMLKLFLTILNKIKIVENEKLKSYEENIQVFLEDADSLFDSLYNTCSIVGYLRAQRDANQTLHYGEEEKEENDADRTNLLIDIAAHRKNSIAYFVKENFKSTAIDHGIVAGYESIVNVFYEALIQNPYNLAIQGRDFFNKKMGYATNPNHDVLVALLDKLALLANDVKLNRNVTLPLNQLWVLLGQARSDMQYGLNISGTERVTAFSTFSRVKANKVGPSQSIMDFAELLGLEFASLINSVYIKMPFASTLAMFLALCAWFITCSGSRGFIPEMIDWLSQAFTGEGAVDLIRITLAAFLFWKLATVVIEAGFALKERDANFLIKLYGDPERLFLGFSSFLGLGIALQWLPLLPDTINLFSNGVMQAMFSMYPEIVKQFINGALSFYPALANLFIIEARVAWHGQIPLNFLEYFFLGLKAVFLFGAIVTGRHKSYLAIHDDELDKIIFQLSILSSRGEMDRPKVAYYLARLYDALGLSLERHQAQQLFNEMSADNAYAETLKDLYNQSIYRGNNNLLQILLLLPGVFITYPYRAVMYGLAHLVDARVIKHGVEKNFSEDLTMFIQVATAMAETFRTFLLGTNQLIKSGSALTVYLLLKVNLLKLDLPLFYREILTTIAIHNAILWPIRKPLSYFFDEQKLNVAKIGYSVLAHRANTDDVLEHEEAYDSLRDTRVVPRRIQKQVSLRTRYRNEISQDNSLDNNIKLEINGVSYIRIALKSDGKNKGSYDGTYVTESAYNQKQSGEKFDKSAYVSGEIFFLKMFPEKKKKLVEGFAEALLGTIIIEMIKQGFIEERYQHCFSAATIIQLPNNAGAALWQPFAVGYDILFHKLDRSQKKKSCLQDTFDRVTGRGYEKYFTEDENYKDELACIILIMVLFGNFSLHSGNILFSQGDQNTIHLNVIDYGAAFRNYQASLIKNLSVWKSLEELIPRNDGYIFKKYLESYYNIPGLFDLVITHARRLNAKLQAAVDNDAFKALIKNAFTDVYRSYAFSITNMFGAEAWETDLQHRLFNYLAGKKEGQSDQPTRDGWRELMPAIVTCRLGQIASASPPSPVHGNGMSSFVSAVIHFSPSKSKKTVSFAANSKIY